MPVDRVGSGSSHFRGDGGFAHEVGRAQGKAGKERQQEAKAERGKHPSRGQPHDRRNGDERAHSERRHAREGRDRDRLGGEFASGRAEGRDERDRESSFDRDKGVNGHGSKVNGRNNHLASGHANHVNGHNNNVNMGGLHSQHNGISGPRFNGNSSHFRTDNVHSRNNGYGHRSSSSHHADLRNHNNYGSSLRHYGSRHDLSPLRNYSRDIGIVRRSSSASNAYHSLMGSRQQTSGVAFTHTGLAEAKGGWLRDSTSGICPVPGQAAAKLNGQQFGNFAEFSRAFWRSVANTPALAAQFSEANLARMRQGLSPIAPESAQYGADRTYSIQNKVSAFQGSSAFDMSNMVIVTPLVSQLIADLRYNHAMMNIMYGNFLRDPPPRKRRRRPPKQRSGEEFKFANWLGKKWRQIRRRRRLHRTQNAMLDGWPGRLVSRIAYALPNSGKASRTLRLLARRRFI